jgi:arylsulfatase A-like enzyme
MFDRKNAPINSMPRLGWGPRDKDVYDFTYKMLRERTDKRPFFLTVATLSLHHPFNLPDPKLKLYPHDSMENKYKNILRYADEQLGVFVEEILSDPKFSNTVILIAADHGMNVGRPHTTWSQSILWEDLVWVPILLVGKKWNAPVGVDDDIRQLADIGPTILDRLGIEIPNHFIGHSLLRKYGPGRQGIAFFGNANGGISAGVRQGKYKYMHYFGKNYRQLYDLDSDPRETRNLCLEEQFGPLCDHFGSMVTDVYVQHTKLINSNFKRAHRCFFFIFSKTASSIFCLS